MVCSPLLVRYGTIEVTDIIIQHVLLQLSYEAAGKNLPIQLKGTVQIQTWCAEEGRGITKASGADGSNLGAMFCTLLPDTFENKKPSHQ